MKRYLTFGLGIVLSLGAAVAAETVPLTSASQFVHRHTFYNLNGANDVAFDRDGRLAIAEDSEVAVKFFDPGGAFIGEIGGRGDGNDQFEDPIAVAFNSWKGFAVADLNNGRVQIYDSNRQYVRTMDSLLEPIGVEYGPGDVLVISDFRRREISLYNRDGLYLRRFGTRGNDPGQLWAPSDVAVDRDDGTIAIVDEVEHEIQVFDFQGNFKFQLGDDRNSVVDGKFANPVGAAYRPDGLLCVTDINRIQFFGPDGSHHLTLAESLSPDGDFQSLSGVAFSEDGNLMAVAEGRRVQVYEIVPEPAWPVGTSFEIYANEFESYGGSEWSPSRRDTSPRGQGFLGRWENDETVTLSLGIGSTVIPQGLPDHQSVTVSFDLFVIDSWDGAVSGGDQWSFGLRGEEPLMVTTFSNPMTGVAGEQQSFPGSYPENLAPAQAGAAQVDSLGYVEVEPLGYRDSVYRMRFTFAHTADSLELDFAAVGVDGGGLPDGLGDESWGLDNVRVTLHPDEEGSQDLLLDLDSPANVHVPTDDSLSLTWTEPDFDDSAWLAGSGPVGYGYSGDLVAGTDTRGLMQGVSPSAFLRFEFELELEPSECVASLILRTYHDDGFVAYLNGIRVVSDNAPPGVPSWSNSGIRTGEGDFDHPHRFDLSAYAHLLRSGRNVLAVHGINESAQSSDFLFAPILTAELGPVLLAEKLLSFGDGVNPHDFPDRPRLPAGDPVEFSTTLYLPGEEQELVATAAVGPDHLELAYGGLDDTPSPLQGNMPIHGALGGYDVEADPAPDWDDPDLAPGTFLEVSFSHSMVLAEVTVLGLAKGEQLRVSAGAETLGLLSGTFTSRPKLLEIAGEVEHAGTAYPGRLLPAGEPLRLTGVAGGSGMLGSIRAAIIPNAQSRAGFALTPLAVCGDGVPGVPGARFRTFSSAVLNSVGDVAFVGGVEGEGIGHGNGAGLWKSELGATVAVARSGDSAGAGSHFAAFDAPVLRDTGRCGFGATIEVGGQQRAARIAEIATGANALLAVEGEVAAGTFGAEYDVLYSAAFPDFGVGFVPGVLKIGGPFADTSNNSGIWGSSGQGFGIVAREGAGTGHVGIDFGQISSRVVCNASGEFLFHSLLGGVAVSGSTNSAVIRASAAGAPFELYSRKGDASPGVSGALFASFQAESISADGSVALHAMISGSGIDTGNDAGIWVAPGTSPLELVVREGAPAPGSAAGVVFNGIGKLSATDRGGVVFASSLRGAGVDPSNDFGVWRKVDGGALEAIILEGGTARGIPGARVATIGAVATNPSGGVMVAGTLAIGEGGVDPTNSRALWVADADGRLELALRSGDVIDVRGEGKSVTGISFHQGINSAGATGGHGAVMNDAGQAILHLFYNGGEGVFLIGSADEGDRVPFDEWIATFGELDPGDRHPLANPDNDRLVNLLERGLGFDPTRPTAAGADRVPHGTQAGGKLALRFPVAHPAPADLTYLVWAANDLTGAAAQVIATKSGNGPWVGSGRVTVEPPTAGGAVWVEVSDVVAMGTEPSGRRFMWLEIVAGPR